MGYGLKKINFIFIFFGFLFYCIGFTYSAVTPAMIKARKAQIAQGQQGVSNPDSEQKSSDKPQSQELTPAPLSPQGPAGAINNAPLLPSLYPSGNTQDLNRSKTAPQQDHGSEDFTRIINNFKTTSSQWRNILNPQTKELVVYYFISEYMDKGIKINKKPASYVDLINDLAAHNPDFLYQPFEQILQVVAIIEYDFDNGQDKDFMAKHILGEEGYLRNKERLGLK